MARIHGGIIYTVAHITFVALHIRMVSTSLQFHEGGGGGGGGGGVEWVRRGCK